MKLSNKLLRSDAPFGCIYLDRGAVRIRRANVYDVRSGKPQKTNENIRLNIFDQMPYVNISVGIRQGARNEDSLHCVHPVFMAYGRRELSRVIAPAGTTKNIPGICRRMTLAR